MLLYVCKGNRYKYYNGQDSSNKKNVYLMRISDDLGSKYHLKFNDNKLLLIQVDLSKVVNIVFNET